jgi:hypothetical protein
VSTIDVGHYPAHSARGSTVRPDAYDVAEILAAEDAKRQRLEEIIADPTCAHPDELSPYLRFRVPEMNVVKWICAAKPFQGRYSMQIHARIYLEHPADPVSHVRRTEQMGMAVTACNL